MYIKIILVWKNVVQLIWYAFLYIIIWIYTFQIFMKNMLQLENGEDTIENEAQRKWCQILHSVRVEGIDYIKQEEPVNFSQHFKVEPAYSIFDTVISRSIYHITQRSYEKSVLVRHVVQLYKQLGGEAKHCRIILRINICHLPLLDDGGGKNVL